MFYTQGQQNIRFFFIVMTNKTVVEKPIIRIEHSIYLPLSLFEFYMLLLCEKKHTQSDLRLLQAKPFYRSPDNEFKVLLPFCL